MTRRAGWLLTAVMAISVAAVSPSLQAQAISPAPSEPQPAERVPPPSRITTFVTASTILNSNIDHDAADTDAAGMVIGIGATAKNDAIRPTFELQYQAGFHRYANASRWNRLSHYARASWDRRLHRRLAFAAVGEGSIKGSTEDQELSDQLALSPRLEYRLTPAFRMRGIGAWRLKRYDVTPDRNAVNRYAAIELLGRPRSGVRWAAGGRFEWNAAESARQSYNRWTWYGELMAPLSRSDRLEIAGRYRRQHYTSRLVSVASGPDALRHDVTVEPEVYWVHALEPALELRTGYFFSGRNSNDPRRPYRSHQVLVSVARRW